MIQSYEKKVVVNSRTVFIPSNCSYKRVRMEQEQKYLNWVEKSLQNNKTKTSLDLGGLHQDAKC